MNEQTLRHQLKKEEHYLKKSRAKNWRYENQCGYMILDRNGGSVAGTHYELDLYDVAEFIKMIRQF